MVNIVNKAVIEVEGRQKGLKKLNSEVKGINTILQDITKRGGFAFKELGIDDVTPQAKKLNKEMFRFDGRLLSIMFLGMQLQKVFTRALKSLFKTFLDVTDNTNALTQRTNQLRAGWEFLKFSIIDALSQSPLFLNLLDLIINIIDAISNWVGQNPALAKFAVIALAVGAALGFLLSQVGQLSLGISALVSLLQAGSPLITTAVSGIGSAFLIVAGIVAAIIVLWTTNIGNFRDFITTTFGDIFKFISNTFITLFSLIKNIFLVLTNILKGNWGDAMKFLALAFIDAFKIVTDSLALSATFFINSFRFAFNLIKDLFFNVVVEGILAGAKVILQGIKGITGIDMGIGAIENLISGVNNFQDGLTKSFMSAEQLKESVGLTAGFFENLKGAVSDVETPQAAEGGSTTITQNNVVEIQAGGLSADELGSTMNDTLNNFMVNATRQVGVATRG